MMKTAVVILNWNTRDFLEKFLPGVLASAGCAPDGTPAGDVEVVVADSASTDGSMELVAERFPAVRRIILEKNYGFTGGYNRALTHLGNEDFRYFVLLNSDVEVPQGWLSPLVEWMDTNPDCGACAPKLHSWQDRDSFEYAGAAGGLADPLGYTFCRGRVMKKVERDNGQYDGPADVFWATGACLVVRAEAFRMVGGLDERFFAHMEEIDLCWRLQLHGWRICVVSDSLVWHVGGGTLPAQSPLKLFLNYRNNLLMLDNNLARTYALDGLSPAKACRKAGMTIFLRMVLDGCSALVYLLTLKGRSFSAVVRAHREFRSLRSRPSPETVSAYAQSWRGKAVVHGRFPRWMVPRALFCSKEFFRQLHAFKG